MDPNVTLALIRNICNTLHDDEYHYHPDSGALLDELIILIGGLDEWLSCGGFRPDDWK